MRDLVGHSLGNYKLLRLVENNKSSQIYFGKCKYSHTHVAVKVSNAKDVRKIGTLEFEAQLLSRMNHPHIVRMYEFGMQNGTQFLVTNWVAYGTLLNLFAQPVSLHKVAAYVKQIASALEYLHTMHIIHQDIKPSNILVEQDGTALLIDFETAMDYRYYAGWKGTPAYTAPEQSLKQSCPASDQYALAVLVYQWLCGETPFHGSPAEIRAQHKSVPPFPLHDKVPELPYAIGEVVLTALAKNPDARFPSVWAFAEALEEASQPSSYWIPSRIPQDYTKFSSWD